VILDAETHLFDLGGSALDETVSGFRGYRSEEAQERVFHALDSNSAIKTWPCFDHIQSGLQHLGKRKDICRALAPNGQDLGLGSLSVLLNTDAAAPFIGKAVEGAILALHLR